MSGRVLAEVDWPLVLPVRQIGYYLVYGDDGGVLYVGVTEAPRSRLKTHARHFKNAASFRFVATSDRRVAEARERALIAEHNPSLNRAPGTGRFGDER
jgi:excinuclease UvrABC nuclease subunit